MTTSHGHAEEKKSSIQAFLAEFKIALPIAHDGSRVFITLFPINQHFNAAVKSTFDEKLNPGTEWNFIQDLYKASQKQTLAEQQAEAEKLLIYIEDGHNETLDLGSLRQGIIDAIHNNQGLVSFLPIFLEPQKLGSGESINKQVVGNIAQNNALPVPKALLLHDAYEKDYLPIRTVICNALNSIEELDKTEKSGLVGKLFDKAKIMISDPNHHAEHEMEAIKTQLYELLKSSIDFSSTPLELQAKLSDLPRAEDLRATYAKLAAKLGADNFVLKMRSFLEVIDKINDNLSELNLGILVTDTPANIARVQKYVEKQQELERKETPPPLQPGK